MTEPEKPMTIGDLLWIIRYEFQAGRITKDTPVVLYDRAEGGTPSWLTSFESHPVLDLDGKPVRANDRSRPGAHMALCLRPGAQR